MDIATALWAVCSLVLSLTLMETTDGWQRVAYGALTIIAVAGASLALVG